MIPIEQVKRMATHRILNILKQYRNGYAVTSDDDFTSYKEQLIEILNSREHVPRKHRKGQNVYDLSQDKVRFWERYRGRTTKRTLLRVT